MSENMPRQGLTRTGKSLKAVRRYYALKNANKGGARSPEEDVREHQQQQLKRKSPPDDKLTRRIAAELKFQHEAIEKRSKRYPGIVEPPTERSAQLAIVQPKEFGGGGPVFQTEASSISAKPLMSNKSFSNLNQIIAEGSNIEASITTLGILLTCLILALVFIIAWTVAMIMETKYNDRDKDLMAFPESGYTCPGALRWMALSSILVLVGVLYWFIERSQVKHALISLMAIILSTLCVTIHIIYYNIIGKQSNNNNNKVVAETPGHQKIRDSFNISLPITYLIIHLITCGIMIRHIFKLLSRQIGERSLKNPGDNNPII